MKIGISFMVIVVILKPKQVKISFVQMEKARSNNESN